MKMTAALLYHRKRDLLLSFAGMFAAMACMAPGCQLGESPMAFSPNGHDLAFTTVEPLQTNAAFLAGPQAFRLMTVADHHRLRIIEERTDAMLTAPAYSPDGRRIAYLRFPLQSAAQQERESRTADERLKPVEHAVDPRWVQWWAAAGHPKPTPAASQPAPETATPEAEAATSQPAIDIIDAALPPLTGAFPAIIDTVFLPTGTAQLVIRAADTGKLLSETAVELPHPDDKAIYMTTLPQFTPDGQWVYLSIGQVAVAVNPATGCQRIVAGNSHGVRLSSDGRTLAVSLDTGNDNESIIGLLATDGQTAVYRRLPFALEAPPVWTDDQTLALIANEEESRTPQSQTSPPLPGAASSPAASRAAHTQPKEPTVLRVYRLRRDGTLSKATRVLVPPSPVQGKSTASGIAIAPDGEHMVIANGPIVFATTTGRILARWHSDEKIILSKPTFSPDSRQVAFKVSRQIAKNVETTDAIVFFTQAGRLLNRVRIPPIAAGTTHPASTTQTKPSSQDSQPRTDTGN